LQGISDWVEQLIAESTGKDGKGILPVCGDPGAELGAQVSSFVPARISNQNAELSWIHLDGSLGELFMAFEVATAAAGYLIGINPFDQPDVESAKKAARESLSLDSSSAEHSDLSEARQLLAEIDREGYLSVQLYASSQHSSPLTNLRERLVAVSKVPVTIGWGPRFLHSTGQFHKGGKPGGAFIQIVQVDDEYPIPGADYGFQQLIEAQAKGDASVLRANGSRVVTLKLGKEEDVVDVLEKLVE
jgi:glucose-6-phosphate isomerase